MSSIGTELSQAGRLLTADEVSRLLCVSRRTVHRLANAGRLERIRLGYRTARYTPTSVEALMSPENEQRPSRASQGVAQLDTAVSHDQAYTE